MADFRYAGFKVSQDLLRSYLEERDVKKSYPYKNRYYADESEVLLSIIDCIASGDVAFDVKNQEMCNILQDIITFFGKDNKGVYTQSAHQAMQQLCIMRGMAPDAVVLQDDKHVSWWKKASEKVGGWFNKNKKVNAQEKPKKPQNNKVISKKPLLRTLATVGTVVGVSALIAFGVPGDTKNSNKKSGVNKKTERVVKTKAGNGLVVKKSSANENKFLVRDKQGNVMAWPYVAFANDAKAKVKTEPKTTEKLNNASEYQLSKINACCESALNIIIGEQARERLYNQIRSQVNRGIFQIPDGMSVERIAHAATMSRIYEGKSIVLTALKSDKKLTHNQQMAFAAHIDGIGIHGEKLQKRVAQKQKLSNYSRFDMASNLQKQAHVRNLQELQKIRTHVR